jgi:hypothetical protein
MKFGYQRKCGYAQVNIDPSSSRVPKEYWKEKSWL